MNEKIILNAENAIAGRTASTAAKELLKGKTVSIVNAEKAMISGDPQYTIKHFKEKVERGDPYHGPFYPKTPDRILKRMVRGMMPYKKPLGMRAYKRLRVYRSIPEALQKSTLTKLPETTEEKSITLKSLAERLK